MDFKEKAKEIHMRGGDCFGSDSDCKKNVDFIEQTISQAFEAGKREGKIEAYRDAIVKCEEYADDGLATPILREIRSVFVMKAAALEKEKA